jgi:hypothetical protein
MNPRFPALLLGTAFLLAVVSPAFGETHTVNSPAGIRVTVDDATGSYEVCAQPSGWTFAGQIGRAWSDVATGSGKDALGPYREIRFSWPENGAPLTAAIRVYRDRPAVLFDLTCDRPVERMPVLFPRFTRLPAGLHPFSYQAQTFALPAFDLEDNGTPWLLFDGRGNAAVLSPADHFMVARMVGDGVREIAGGLNPRLTGLPAGFTQGTLVVFGQGINSTWDAWGGALMALDHRSAPANDADVGLRYLGYWTDNGATYYYRYEPALGYAGTLEAVVHRWRAEHIPVRYLQLDSWWYEKSSTSYDGTVGRTKNPDLPAGPWNRYGGLLRYRADPFLFPHGLADFQKEIGLPLITHNRWIDLASPYRQAYRISGVAAVDPRFWSRIMGYLAASGVATYEQDWLDRIYNYSPKLGSTPGLGAAFTGDMARAARARGLTLQYCMPLPRYFLQGARYDNLTTIRVSDDRFQRSRWDNFLYVSRLAGALGIWPWTDVFMSRETDNLLLATLSGGMVGVGDALGAEDKANLLRSVRPDGVIVKPDAPIVPADAVYLADAAARGDTPMLAWTYTDHGPLRTAYVFTYRRHGPDGRVRIAPDAFGLRGPAVVCDPRTGTLRRLAAGGSFVETLPERGTAYFVIAPVGPSGIAFFGDQGKFVTDGRQRIAALSDAGGRVGATVRFAAGEASVRLFGWAPRAPRVEALAGSAGAVAYDAATGRFEVSVSPAPAVAREPPGNDPVQQARIELSLPPPRS